jgi:hypothetical protein
MAINQQNDVSQRQNFYCKIFINDVELIPQNIISCTIRSWVFDFLPRLELIIIDDGLLTEVKPLKDNSTIHITFGRSINDEHLVDVEFTKQDHTIDVISNKITNIYLTGLLKTKNTFFPLYNRSFSKKTSKDVLKQIASDIGVKFITNHNFNTVDTMNWLQINQTNYDMVKHVLKHAYKADDTIFCYVDIEGKMNYTSLKTEADKVDIIPARLDLKKFSESILEDEDMSTLWYNTYDVKSIEGFSNLSKANGQRFSYFDGSSTEYKTQTISFNAPKLIDQEARSNKGETVEYTNFGQLFPNAKQKNVFNKYYEAQVLNDYVKWGFFNQSILINVNASKSINLFDKIAISIPSLIEQNNNDVYSGEYLVGGITHQLSKGNIYSKQISLHRAGTNKAEFGTK